VKKPTFQRPPDPVRLVRLVPWGRG